MARKALLSAATATNSPPSGATAGVDIASLLGALGVFPEAFSFLVYSTAGSATMTVTVRIWGYDEDSGFWFPLGYLNGGSAIAELSTDIIRHAEPMDLAGHFDRLYAELTTIGGTSTAITVVAKTGKKTP